MKFLCGPHHDCQCGLQARAVWKPSICFPLGHEVASHHCGCCWDIEVLRDRNDCCSAVVSVLGREQWVCWNGRGPVVRWTHLLEIIASSHCVAPALQHHSGGVCAWGVQGEIIPVLSGQLAKTSVKSSSGTSWLVFFFSFPLFLSTLVQMSMFSHASTWASRFNSVCLCVQAHFSFPSVVPFLQKTCSPWESRRVLLGFL